MSPDPKEDKKNPKFPSDRPGFPPIAVRYNSLMQTDIINLRKSPLLEDPPRADASKEDLVLAIMEKEFPPEKFKAFLESIGK